MEQNQNTLIKEKLVDKRLNVVLSITIVILGSIFMSISTSMFLTPLQLYAGGVTGIAQIILQIIGLLAKNDATIFNQYLSIANLILLLPFNVLAFYKLSKKYAIYTLISSIVQTIVLSFSEFWISLNVFKNIDGTYDTLACVIVASIVNGIANGMMMRRGATSGGIITYCQYLNLKKGKSVGNISLFTSALIMIIGAIVSFVCMKNSASAIGYALSIALYTLMYFILSNLILDYVHTSYNKVKLEIVTENGKMLASELLKTFRHGITIENGLGAYTGRNKDILSVVVQKYECNKYISMIKVIDSQAFITVIPVWRLTGRFNVQIIDK